MNSRRVHFVGIGGAGLSALATLLLEMGYTVSGSDLQPTEITAELARRGAIIYSGHRAGQVFGTEPAAPLRPDVVVISSAIPADNPEVVAARAAGIPVLKRGDFLRPLLQDRHAIGVAGTHGKTTTTGMIAIVLLRAGLDPSFVIGGRLTVGPGEGLPSGQTAAHAGQGPFVIEADEYDGMFLSLPLETAVVTNVEWDHVDCYPSPKAFAAAFRRFVGQLPAGGHLALCADDPGALALREAAPAGVTVATYGLGTEADRSVVDLRLQARELTPNRWGGMDAGVWQDGVQVATLSLAIPGPHNIRNALAALLVAGWNGVPLQRAAAMLRDFRGAGRRFEVIGQAGGVTVIDDYGHHPTEIAATLTAARLRFPGRRIWAVFQPHTYSRTLALLDDFARCFDDADRVLLLDIYPARERDDLGMHSRRLLARMNHPGAQYVGGIEAAADYLLAHVDQDDVVITLSAGDGNRVGRLLLDGLGSRIVGAHGRAPEDKA